MALLGIMMKKIKELIPYIVILVVVILIRTYVATPVIVNGPSMQTTLYTNDMLVLKKTKKINRYDIVVANHNGDKLIKRVMAIPGDMIKCVSGTIYVNNEEVTNYGYGVSFDFPETRLKENEYYLIGDNREDSLDSRYFGPVSLDDISGVVDFRIYPFTKFGKIN